LLTFSLGLGIQFMMTALLFNSLTEVFKTIKKHYDLISKISGGFLIFIGILMILDKFVLYSNIFY
ncbi:MAG: cytochrome c biogenesis protein CcdA, partial [Clostridiaceae bacterium]